MPDPAPKPPTLTPLAPDQSNPPPDPPKAPDPAPKDPPKSADPPKDQPKDAPKDTPKDPPKSDDTLLGKKPATPAGAPDKYEFTLPEGFTLSDELNEQVTTLFKEAGLPQETAQKLLDFHANALRQVTNSHTEAWETTRKAWIDEIRSDKDIGSGDERILKPEVASRVSKLIDTHLGGDSFRAALAVTGAGNNPVFARALNTLATLLGEGKHVDGKPTGQSGDPKSRTPGARVYPHLAQKE